jgi:HEPN domain-containing protein
VTGSFARSWPKEGPLINSLTREWVRKAEADYRAAVKLSRGNEDFHDQVCSRGQQSAEKYLEALLEELGMAVAKTRDLSVLLTALRPHHPALESLWRGLRFLTEFAVDTRYPGNDASKRQARTALRWADKVRTAARTILKLRQHPPRRKK